MPSVRHPGRSAVARVVSPAGHTWCDSPARAPAGATHWRTDQTTDMPGTAPSLSDNEVRVFFARPDRLAADRTARDVLSAVDRAHVSRFVFERDRTVALASRALQRLALSQCVNVTPDAWSFAAVDGGKPYVSAPASEHDLQFSVANCVGLVACAVTRGRPIGLDVEPARPDVMYDVVERCWTRRERAHLESVPLAARLRRFAETWTAKESYVKARGVGLALDLRDVDIDLDVDPPQLTVAERSGADGAAWRLFSWFPIETHAAALCVHHENRDVHVTHRWIEDCDASANQSSALP